MTNMSKIEKIKETLNDDIKVFFKHKDVKTNVKELDNKYYITLKFGKRDPLEISFITDDENLKNDSDLVIRNIMEWFMIYAIQGISEGVSVKLPQPYKHNLTKIKDDLKEKVVYAQVNKELGQICDLLKEKNPFKKTRFITKK